MGVAFHSEGGTNVAKLQGKFLAAGEFAGLAIVLVGAPRATQLVIDCKAGVDAWHASTSQQLSAKQVYAGIVPASQRFVGSKPTGTLAGSLDRRGRCAVKIRARA